MFLFFACSEMLTCLCWQSLARHIPPHASLACESQVLLILILVVLQLESITLLYLNKLGEANCDLLLGSKWSNSKDLDAPNPLEKYGRGTLTL